MDTLYPPAGHGHLADVVAALDARRPALVDQLATLVTVPSVAGRTADLHEMHERSAALLAGAGLLVEALEVDDAPPYVAATSRATGDGLDRERTRVLLYAHYDVQPAEPANWHTPPFEPDVRSGRLFARGAADNKAAIVAHAAAVSAWIEARGGTPVPVTVFVEGEEEQGSPHLDRLLALHGDHLDADVLVVPDAANWDTGWPALTTTMRGLATIDVTVSTLEADQHQGMWGGAVPDATGVLIRILASLQDHDGRPAVPGFTDGMPEPDASTVRRLRDLATDGEAMRRSAGLRDGVAWSTDPGRVLEASWLGPALTVTGMCVPSLEQAANQLSASAGARLTVRSAPGQDTATVVERVVAHLRNQARQGARLDVDARVHARSWSGEPDAPAARAMLSAQRDAFGREPVVIGGGGSIPLVVALAERLPDAVVLLPGLGDPQMRAHGPDESMPLGDLRRAALTEVLFLDRLAALDRHQSSG